MPFDISDAIFTIKEAPPFTDPRDIGGNFLFLRSTELVTKDGSDRVSQHGDQQTVGPYNFIQTTDAKKPLFVADQLDGYPSIRLDGIDDYLINTAIGHVFEGLNTPFSMFWVAKRISVTGYTWWSASQFESSRPLMDFMDYYENYTLRRLDGGQIGGGSPNASWHYFVLTFNGTNVTLRVDGVAVIDNLAIGSCDMIAPYITAMVIGGLGSGGGVIGITNIEYTDWSVYNLAISAGDITLLENYAHGRYPSI